uniref:Ubiquitin-like protease family profile domain-containing protein n=1 Tax=Chenopodium quinoa TaxID=63459 RepID=A0A803MVW1_CHEQI
MKLNNLDKEVQEVIDVEDGSNNDDGDLDIKKTHCRPNAVFDIIKTFSERQKLDVISIGFEGLLELKLTQVLTKMLPWLCHHFNENSCMFKIDMLKEFFVTSYDVQDVFLLPNLTENKLTYQLRKQPLANITIQNEWKKKLGIVEKDDIFVKNLENKIKSLQEGGDDFKRNCSEYVCKCIKSNKSRMQEIPELHQVVADYCFLKNKSMKSEQLIAFEAPIAIPRDDMITLAPTVPNQLINSSIRPLKISLASQKTSQEAKDRSPKSVLAGLSQTWLDWLQLCNVKDQFMGVDLEALSVCLRANGKRGVTTLQKIWEEWTKTQALDLDAAEFIILPLKMEDHYFVAIINLKNETVDYLDITEYEDTTEWVFQIPKFLKKRKHPKAEEMLNFNLGLIELPFLKSRQDNYSGSYLFPHMKAYDGINGLGLGSIKDVS